MATLDPMGHTIMINYTSLISSLPTTATSSSTTPRSELGRNWQRSVGYYKKGNNNEVKKGLTRLVKDERKRQSKPYGLVQELTTKHKPSTWTWDNDMQEYLLEERQHFKAEMKMLQAELKNAKECCRAESRKFETDKKLYGELLTERDEFTDELGCSFSLSWVITLFWPLFKNLI